MADEETKTVKITITDNELTHRFAGSRVPVSVNGQIAHIKVGEETEVGEHVTEALTNAGIPFTVSEPAGSAGSSAGGVSVDDPRDLVVPAGAPGNEPASDPTQTPDELKQDDKLPSGNESGELKNAANSGGDTAAETAGDTEHGANANGTSGANSDGDQEEPGHLDKSIPDLTTALAEITDPAEIDKLLAAEKAGKSRVDATAALEARKAELAA